MAEQRPFLNLLSGKTPAYIPGWIPEHFGHWDPAFRAWLATTRWAAVYEDPVATAALSVTSAQELALDAVTLWANPLGPLRLLGYSPVVSDQGNLGLDQVLYSPAQIQQMRMVDQSGAAETEETAIAAIKSETSLPVVVRLYGPFTQLGYLIEGNEKWHPRLRALLFQYPSHARTLLTYLVRACARWAKRLRDAGADAVYIDEHWAGLLNTEDQAVFVTPWLTQLIQTLADAVPVMVSAPTMDYAVGAFHKAGMAAFAPGIQSDPQELREKMLWSNVLLAPFDAGRLVSPAPVIGQSAGRLVEAFGSKDLMMSVSGEMLPHVPVAHVRQLFEAVKQMEL